ncbi:MAG: polysaccharide biosynthesis C-terminal domain-containing protein [Bacteroidetes bacterium]|nr:polysaccharide biosynthesis C-terminal domain-containing protein [Bacteroidota bacterium]
MGIVQRDSIRIMVISYLGAAIGYLNKILLFTNFLTAEQVGLSNIIISIAAVYAQFSGLGMTGVTIKFFPYFKDKEKHHHGFLFWTSLLSLFGFLLLTIIFLLFKSPIINYYSEKSPLLVEYSFYVIPLALATVYYNLLEVFLRSLMKTVVFSLVNEIVLRLMISASILLFAFKLVSFHEFVIIYVGVNCSATLILLVYMAYLKQLLFKPEWSSTTKRFFKIVLHYGSFAIVGNMSYILMNNIDALMVAAMIGLKDTGVYTTVFFIATVMLIPYRSLARVASPLVAQFWKNREMKKMHDLYKKVTLMSLITGCFIFLGLWVNIDNIFHFIPDEYASGKYVFLFLGIGRLFDMATGINGIILVTSKKYRYDLLFTILLIGVMIALNLAFIPTYGIEGASFATMLSIITLNTLRIIYIWSVFGMQPFDFKSVWVILIGVFTLGVIYFIPPILNVYADMIIRSLICLVLYAAPVLWLKLSEEVNENAIKILKAAHLYPPEGRK